MRPRGLLPRLRPGVGQRLLGLRPRRPPDVDPLPGLGLRLRGLLPRRPPDVGPLVGLRSRGLPPRLPPDGMRPCGILPQLPLGPGCSEFSLDDQDVLFRPFLIRKASAGHDFGGLQSPAATITPDGILSDPLEVLLPTDRRFVGFYHFFYRVFQFFVWINFAHVFVLRLVAVTKQFNSNFTKDAFNALCDSADTPPIPH